MGCQHSSRHLVRRIPSLHSAAEWYARWTFILLCAATVFFVPGGIFVALGLFISRYVYYKTVLRPAYKFPPLQAPCHEGTFVARDGIKLKYFFVRPLEENEGAEACNATTFTNAENAKALRGKKVLLFSNGVGATLDHIRIVVDRFVPLGYVVLSWDYRGLHGSQAPSRVSALSMRDHAEDARELLDTLHVDCVHAFMGWSTGVQTGLEFAGLYPDRLSRLVLFNGNHSHSLSSAFMPLCRLPLARDIYHLSLNYLFVPIASMVGPATERFFDTVYPLVCPATVQVWAALYGQPLIEHVVTVYLKALFSLSPSHATSYLRICQQLDNQSVLASVPEIETPALLVSAMLDMMTPCWQMYDLEAMLPHAVHYNWLLGTHFVLMEMPSSVLPVVENFILEPPEFSGCEESNLPANSKRHDISNGHVDVRGVQPAQGA